MNFFVEQGENAIGREETTSGKDTHCCSEEERKMVWMRETRIRFFMQMDSGRTRIGVDGC